MGRFAPSPTGDLHLGSLLAAVGSYLDARHHRGRWLVRMEDLDTPRVVPGSADRILRTLEAFGLHWDGDVIYQSQRSDVYGAALDQLQTAGYTFECSCSRRDMSGTGDTGYPGTCRLGPTRRGVLTATRFRVPPDFVVLFDDGIQGKCRFNTHELGDVIIRRKDKIIAYQLAVVLDDALQHVTNVVRGTDLLESTAWQILLQQALKLSTPSYAHLPLVVEQTHEKLSKSRHSVPVEPARAGVSLTTVLRMLNHPPPPELENDVPERLLEWAVHQWNPVAVAHVRSVTARDTVHAK
ncbi:MAG: tRNA glutamyl-Q(34) synthetase GluQRS [Proteobacteria bacterium]|nr:tRNA glutamyl-Q(34) synthetase GluQRS [Pseudomonadota bacterium]